MNDEDMFKKQQGKFKIHSTIGKIERHSNLKEKLWLKTSILDKHIDPIFLHDIEGNCIYLNKTACKFLGYTKDELMKTNLYDLNFPEFSKLNLHSEEPVKQELKFQSTHFKKDKSIIPVEIHSKLIEVESEKLVLSTVQDITELKKTEENLRWNINLIRSVAENSPLAFYVVDNKTDSVLYLNHNFCKLWGLKGLEKEIKEGKLKNKDIILKILPLAEDKEYFMETCAPLHHEENRSTLEDEISLTDGRIIRRFSKQIRDKEDHYFGRLFICEDISERKKIENSIKDREEHLSLITDNMLDLMFQVNSDGIFEYVSPSVKDLLGYEAEDIIGKRDYEFIGMAHPDDFEILIDTIQSVIQTLKPNRTQHRLKHADGHYIWVETVGNPLSNIKGEFSGAVYITRDIKELKKVETQLKSSLEEKEVLLREIHHRVKNNMQIISSLLNLQSRYLNDKKTVNVLNESRNRVRSMAMVHEELYRSRDLSKIDFADYIQRLLSGLFNSYGIDKNLIKPKINVENILLNIDTAVPCGLIINELVSNSLKHAFVQGQKGNISIKFHPQDEKYVLKVADDGVGFPENIDFNNTKTLGLQLVTTLVKQLSGSINIYRDTGTLFKIVF
ncbi:MULTISPECIES: PAS domain S-box protein [Methanobacterium]|jgi:PAS domain S-box-containing protein|uniref:PAS domain S-box protein n=1 Tax=Methanobacterium veterum TaxID=408577 RepID=A0A9E4ZXV1_9EURY|nr:MULTISPECIES: PAS domain S-box protein [Methanobacterium]MCZ3366111.1 PAS domain S-box protein [Methanobacterium veterum]MCZ3371661.1 PAS domain S-box protein [Methanobacterium veterum]